MKTFIKYIFGGFGLLVLGVSLAHGASVLFPYQGGTGRASLTANNVVLGNGANAVNFVAPGSNGNVLTSNGTTWTSAAGNSGSVSATGTANYFPYYTATTTLSATSSIYQSSGNVGIGTTSPGAKLDIKGVSQAGAYVLQATDSTGGIMFLVRDDSTVQYGNSNVGGQFQFIGKNGTSYSYTFANNIGNYLQITSNRSGTASFNIDSLGNVGLGTTAPSTLLDVNGTTTFRGPILAGTDNTYDIGASGATRPRTGYFGTAVISGDYLQASRLLAGQGTGRIKSPSAGVIGLYDNTEADFARLQFGGTTASFPSLKRNGADLLLRVADDSGYANLGVGTIATGTWNGTAIGVAYGGTATTTLAAHNVLIGNGTGGVLSVAPSTSGNVLTSNGTDWTSAAPAAGGSSAQTINITAGETLNTNDAVFVASSTVYTSALTITVSDADATNMGKSTESSTAGAKLAQSINESVAIQLDRLILRLGKNTPVDNVIVEVQSDNSNAPSGTVLASTTIANATISGSGPLAINADFAATVSLSASTKYWIVIHRAGSTTDANYFFWYCQDTSAYANGTSARSSGAGWAVNGGTDPVCADYGVTLQTLNTAGKGYRTIASTAGTSDAFLGFANGTTTVNNIATVTTGGVYTGLTGLNAGSQYYLSNTVGAIAVAPGTVKRKVGIAASSTALMITNVW